VVFLADMYSKLGTIELSGHIYGDIKTDGGYIDVKRMVRSR